MKPVKSMLLIYYDMRIYVYKQNDSLTDQQTNCCLKLDLKK